jgi:hypothetical protein
VLEVVFLLLEFSSPSRRIFIGSHSLPPLWFAVSVLHYSGYHQIAIKEEDQEKTAFITPFGAYSYTTMSFRLKNAGATYQRAIQACFKRQLNKNVEAYVDDVVVKT